MPKHLLASFVLTVGCNLAAQNTAAVPLAFANLPGNAGLAMPLRWSEGKLQVFVDEAMLPNAFAGETISGLRLRRAMLLGSGAYPAMTRTITIRGAFQGSPAVNMIGDWSQNRPANSQVLFGPAVVSVAATSAAGPSTTVGAEFVQITFSQPLPVTPGTLFLEFETTDGPLQVAPDNWVDAVWFEGGVDDGYVAVVGDGTCTTLTEPTELRYTSSDGPISGTTVSLEVTGAPPTIGAQVGFVLVWVGLDPENRAPGPTFTGYGGSFGPADPLMVDCHQWAPVDVSWFGTTDSTGRFSTTLDIPGAAAIGDRLGLQAAWFDPSRPVIPLSFSNGLQLVCNSAGVESNCNTFFFPGTAMVSPWGPQIGLMPVLLLDY